MVAKPISNNNSDDKKDKHSNMMLITDKSKAGEAIEAGREELDTD